MYNIIIASTGWWRGVAITRFIRWTKLFYAGQGWPGPVLW